MISTIFIKSNLGLSFCDKYGNKPHRHTFNFNMSFNVDKLEKNPESIELLRENGTDFDMLRDYGCDQQEVVNGLRDLFRDRTIRWVTFHG